MSCTINIKREILKDSKKIITNNVSNLTNLQKAFKALITSYQDQIEDQNELYEFLCRTFNSPIGINEFSKVDGAIDIIHKYFINPDTVRILLSMSKVDEQQDLDNGNKESSLDGSLSNIYDNLFIYKQYGISPLSTIMTRNFDLQIVSAIICDGDNFITTNEQINANIAKYQQQLFGVILDYIKTIPSLKEKYKSVRKEDFHENPLQFLSELKEDLKSILNLDSKNSLYLDTRYNEYYSNPDSKQWCDTYNALFILSNFDSLIRYTFGKSISIKPYTFGRFLPIGEIKYKVGHSSNLSSTWHDETKDIDFTKEIGDINKKIINSRQRYDRSGNKIANRYITFEEVANVVTKIQSLYNKVDNNKKWRDSRINIDSIEISQVLQQLKDCFGDDIIYMLTESPDATFGTLIAQCCANPTIAFPILFNLLPLITSSSDFTNNEWEVIKSIQENFFSLKDPSSFLQIHMKSPNGITNYYTYICQLFDSLGYLQLRQYKEDDDRVIRPTTLKDNGLETSRWNLENRINASLTPLSILSIDKNFVLSENHLSIDQKPEDQYLIYNYKISDTDQNTYQLIIKTNGQYELSLNGDIIKIVDLDDHFDNLLKIFAGITKIKELKIGSNFYNLYKDSFSSHQTALLLSLTAHCLYNREVQKLLSSKKIEGNNINSYLSKFYTSENMPQQNKLDYTIKATSKDDAPILRNLSQILDVLSGRYVQNVVKDGENKQISSIGLAMLATNIRNQYELIEKSEASASKHFSILGAFKGVEFVRDFKGLAGQSKNATKFSHKEVFTSLLLDYFSKQPAFMTDVISDKSRLIRVLIDPNYKIQIREDEEFGNLENIQELNGKTLSKLTYDDLILLTSYELGKYYQSIQNNTIQKYNQLANTFKDYLQTEKGQALLTALSANVIFDILYEQANITYLNPLDYSSETDFVSSFLGKEITEITPEILEEVKNKWIQNINFDIYNQEGEFGELKDISLLINILSQASEQDSNILMNELIHDLLLLNPNIRLIEGIDGTIEEGILKPNKLVQQQIDRWSSLESARSYFYNKEVELIQDLLYNDIDILIRDKSGNPIKWGNLAKSEWIKGNKVIIAKFDYYDFNKEKGITLNSRRIANINDLNYLREKIYRFGFTDQKYNPYSSQFNLIDFIDAVNFTAQINKYISEINSQYLVQNENGQSSYNYDKIKKDLQLSDDDHSILREKYYEWRDSQARQLASSEERLISEITINPELKKFNVFNYFVGREFQNSTVGTHLNHPGSTEAERWLAAVKRNVSHTATKHKYILNTLGGLFETIDIAVIDDDVDYGYNVTGKKMKSKPFDGATWENNIISYLENSSLGDSKAGIVKKPFIHDKDANSGSGIIIKTAAFPITNQLIRNSKEYYRMNQKTMSRLFTDQNGNLITPNITVDFTGRQIDFSSEFGDIIYYDPETKKYWKTINVVYNQDGTTTVTRNQVLVKNDNSFEITNDSDNITFVANNDFAIWKNIFGGEWSYSVQNDKKLSLSDKSFENMANLVSMLGIVTKDANSKVFSQNNVYQYAKRSLIGYLVSKGAIKQGAANINSRKAYFDDNYDLTTFPIHLYDAGIQLDAEHVADDSVLSMMTQVVNALGARGYTADQADEIYKALHSLASIELQNLADGLNAQENSIEFKNAILKVVVDSILKSSAGDNQIMQNISYGLQNLLNSNKEITWKIIVDNNIQLPLSHPMIFRKLISNISSSLTKKCVRIKFPGILAVLNPSNRLIKLYDGHLMGYYKGNMDNILEKKQKTIQPISVAADLKFGTTYNVVIDPSKDISLLSKHEQNIIQQFVANPNLKLNIEDPRIYYEYRNLINNGYLILTEDLRSGRDLASYNITFKDIDGNSYCLYDLFNLQALYILQNKEEKDQTAIANAYQNLQLSLNALSNYNNNDQVLIIDENGKSKYITVDKNTIQHHNYECILPKVYKTQFGLRNGDSVQEIEKNPYFFVTRLLENYNANITIDLFDFELKQVSGNHLYLLSTLRDIPENLRGRKVEIQKRLINGKLYRINPETGKQMYRLFNDSDEVYVSENGTEILRTQTPQLYIDHLHYMQFLISPELARHLAKHDQFDKLWDILKGSHKTQSLLTSLQRVDPNNKKYSVNEQLVYNISRGYSSKEELENAIGEIYQGKENLKGYIYIKADQLIEAAQELHTSFLSSLKVLAARIPAQSHQSFMSMKVVAFDDEDLNNAYVSRMQFILQGSDLDIDKASFLGRKYRNGRLVVWSPFFNLSDDATLVASEYLPFPTGNKIKETEIESFDENNIVLVNYLRLLNDLQQADIDHENIIRAKIIRYANKIGYIPLLATAADKQEENYQNALKACRDMINLHNTYLNDKDLTDPLINFIATGMFNISQDSSNLIQSTTSVDDPVDIIKSIAKLSSSQSRSKRYDAGNVMNEIETLILTLSGKQNTGIVASAMKVFEAMSQYYYNVLNNGSDKEIEKLLIYRKILNKDILFLANAYDKYNRTHSISNPEISSKVQQALNSIDNFNDAFILFSAMLSLSTDNAKDPVLSKINADPEMISLYMSGLALGLDIQNLCNLIMSDVGVLLNRLQKGNIFYKEDPCFNISSAIQFVRSGPIKEMRQFFFTFENNIQQVIKKYGLSDEGKDTISVYSFISLLQGKTGSPDQLKLILNDIHKSILGGESVNIDDSTKFELIKQELDELNNKSSLNRYEKIYRDHLQWSLDNKNLKKYGLDISGLIKSKYGYTTKEDLYKNQRVGSAYYNFLDAYNRWSHIKSVIYGNDYNRQAFNDIIQLNAMSDEMSSIRIMTALNQQLPNSVEDSISFLWNFEDIIKKRLSQLKKDGQQRPKEVQSLLKTLQKQNEQLTGISDYSVNLHEFINNENYRQLIFDIYDLIKFAVNPFRVIYNVENYRGYLETVDILLQAGNTISKYNVLYKRGKDVLYNLNIVNATDKRKILRNMEKFIDKLIIDNFLSDGEYSVNLAGFGQSFDKNGNKHLHSGNLKLNTEEARQTFKYWMENIVIPNLQKDSTLMGNKFISDLQLILSDRIEQSGNNTIAYTLNANMSPRPGSFDESQLSEYRSALFTLNKINSKYGNLFTLFYLYNLIVYNGQQSQNSFSKLFDMIDVEQVDIIESYKKYINQFEFGQRDINELINDEQMYDFIALPIDIMFSRANIGLVKDRSKGKYVLVQRIAPIYGTAESEIDEDLIDFEQDQEDDLIGLDFDDFQGYSFEGELKRFGYELKYNVAQVSIHQALMNAAKSKIISIDESSQTITYKEGENIATKSFSQFFAEAKEKGHYSIDKSGRKMPLNYNKIKKENIKYKHTLAGMVEDVEDVYRKMFELMQDKNC